MSTTHGNQDLAIDREQEVIAHLSYVAAEVDRVTVDLWGRIEFGRLDFPDFDRMAIPFTPSFGTFENDFEPPRGVPVRVSYQADGETYGFLTLVKGIDAQKRWMLCIPVEIEGTQRRFARRVIVREAWKFKSRSTGYQREDQVLEVHDVSASGMSLVFDPEETQFHPGRNFAGVLTGPGGRTLALRAEIRNVVDLDETGTRQVAGCIFQVFGFNNHAILAEMLRAERDLQTPT